METADNFLKNVLRFLFPEMTAKVKLTVELWMLYLFACCVTDLQNSSLQNSFKNLERAEFAFNKLLFSFKDFAFMTS